MADPLNLLRNILNARLTVTVESSSRLIERVQARQRALAKKKKPKAFKTPAVVQTLAGSRPWTVRPVDLLRKLGEMTTPFLPLENMAKLSASWATRRYFWAIEPLVASKAKAPFRLSAQARDLDFHQKTLLSDEFGVGLGGLLMEHYFKAPNCCDTSYALRQATSFQGISLTRRSSPDYVMWGLGATYYVVECKGCQTSRSYAIDQIRRGLEQVLSVKFAPGRYRSETFVVSTFLDKYKTRIFVVDPPGDEEEPPEEESRTVSVADPEEFARRTSLENRGRLLAWAGLYQAAARTFHELGRPLAAVEAFERTRQRRETPTGVYEGTAAPLFPELGKQELTLFTGVRPRLIEPAKRHPEAGEEFDAVDSGPMQEAPNIPSNISVGRNGTCMIVEGM